MSILWSCSHELHNIVAGDVSQRFVRVPSLSEFSAQLKGPPIESDLSKFVSAEVKAGTAFQLYFFFVNFLELEPILISIISLYI